MITKNSNSKKLLVAICLFIFFISCSSDDKTWKIAKLNNDKLSYEFYLSGHPEGAYRDSAQIKIKEIKNTPPPILTKVIPPIALWGNKIIDSLTLQISISSFNSKKFKQVYELVYYKTIKEILNNIGIKVIPRNSKYTTKLKMILNVKALRASYLNLDYLYVGYELGGSISLTREGETPYTVPINKTEPCPEILYLRDWDPSPYRNPEYVLYHESNIRIRKYLFEFFYNVWGPSPFVWKSTNKSPSFNVPAPPELKTNYDKDLSKDLINNIIRACCSDNDVISERAMEFVSSQNFKRTIGANVLKEIDPSVIEVIPILIQKAEWTMKKGFDSQYPTTLEIITGNKIKKTKFDSKKDTINRWKRWRTWWFYNKQNLLAD